MTRQDKNTTNQEGITKNKITTKSSMSKNLFIKEWTKSPTRKF